MWTLKLELDDERDAAWMKHAAAQDEVGVDNDGTLLMEFDDVESLLRTVDRIHEAGVQFMYRMESAWQNSKGVRPPTAMPGA